MFPERSSWGKRRSGGAQNRSIKVGRGSETRNEGRGASELLGAVSQKAERPGVFPRGSGTGEETLMPTWILRNRL